MRSSTRSSSPTPEPRRVLARRRLRLVEELREALPFDLGRHVDPGQLAERGEHVDELDQSIARGTKIEGEMEAARAHVLELQDRLEEARTRRAELREQLDAEVARRRELESELRGL